MADNVTLNGSTYATDEVGGVHYQYVKLIASSPESTSQLTRGEDSAHSNGDHGIMALAVRQDTIGTALAGNSGDYIPLITDSLGRLIVAPASVARIAVSAAGLTTATTAYTSGDVLGGELTFANAARYTGGTGTVLSAVVTDRSDVLGAVDLFLFRAASTPAANNAAASWADADMESCVGVIAFEDMIDAGGNRVCGAVNVGITYDCAATSLFGVLVTRSDHAIFATSTAIQVTLMVARD